MISLRVNGQPHAVPADPEKPLLWVLRDELNLKGTKYGCGVGVCGICTVLIDGEPNHACMVPLRKAAGHEVLTVEGLAQRHPALVQAWIAAQVPQCGYCQGGQLLAAAALLNKKPRPTNADIDAALSGVLCRCATYPRIRRALKAIGAGPVMPASAPRRRAEPAAAIALNDFIRIAPDNSVMLVINHSEMGQGTLTGLCLLTAEELEVELAQIRTEFAPAAACYRNPMWGEQFTGGSSSIRGEWEPLRRTAAEARARLIAAAAKRWKARPGECRAERGHVVHAKSGARLAYAELAAVAAGLKPPERLRLKDPSEFRLIGHAAARLDIPDMIVGRTLYGIDVARPGMLVATVLRCPVFGGRMKRFDAGEALAVAGVREVVPIASGVAVAADDFTSALRGRERLQVEWDLGPHAQLNNEIIHAQLSEAARAPGKLIQNRGRTRSILKSATRVFEAEYVTPYLAHATLEPMNCVAEITADGCDIWTGTQNQEDTQKVAAEITGLPKKRVRVHTQFLGGGFGRRLETDFIAETVELAHQLGRPVQVVWTRADDLQHDRYRPAGAALLKAALDDSGRPVAWFMRFAGPELALEGIHFDYTVAHLREEHVEVESAVPTGPWRSVGASQNAFAIECFIDELARAAARDPFEYRHALLKDAPQGRAVLERAAEIAGWGRRLPAGGALGIAAYRSFGSWVAMVAEVAIEGKTIKVPRVWAAIDCGIAVNPDAVRAQIEGAIGFGLSAALKEEVCLENGRVTQASFEDYPILTLAEMPAVEVHIMPSREPPGGVGEPGVPVIAPAVANAVHAATGKPVRRLPIRL